MAHSKTLTKNHPEVCEVWHHLESEAAIRCNAFKVVVGLIPLKKSVLFGVAGADSIVVMRGGFGDDGSTMRSAIVSDL